MKTIKLFDAVRVNIDDESELVKDGFPGVWDMLNMTGDVYKDARTEIVRSLMCFNHVDLSAAYPGHHVTLEIIPCKG